MIYSTFWLLARNGPRGLAVDFPGRNQLKKFALFLLSAAVVVSTARAGSVTLSLHTTGDTPFIDLSTILNQWGTPSDTSSVFTIGGTGTDKIGGLNLVNDTGEAITDLTIYAYGTTGANSYSCSNDSGSPFTDCTAPGNFATSQVIPIGSPISWNYSTGGSLATNEEFRLVDTATGTGSDMFYEIEINGQGPSDPSAVPEPASVMSLASGLVLLGFFALRRKLQRQA